MSNLYDLGNNENRFDTLYTPMSPLEALDIIKSIQLSHMEYDSDENYDGELEYEAVEVDDGTVEDNFEYEIKIIENALKEQEDTYNIAENSMKAFDQIMSNADASYNETTNKLNAFKILNKKHVDIHRLKNCYFVEEYNNKYEGYEYHLDIDEFHFLKEVLQNE